MWKRIWMQVEFAILNHKIKDLNAIDLMILHHERKDSNANLVSDLTSWEKKIQMQIELVISQFNFSRKNVCTHIILSCVIWRKHERNS
jgi:hypothetical protein